MSAVVEREQTQVAPQNDAASFIQMVERASRDPSVDIDKLERLLQMHERMTSRQAESAFNAALAAMQTELPEMPERGEIKNRTGGVQSTYALWEDINQIIKPILSRHGFALSFRTGNDALRIIVTGVLRHAGGHSDTSTFILPVDTSGSKNEVQGLGSSTSYGKRYVACALLNLTSRGEDNDGAGKDKPTPWTQELKDLASEAAKKGLPAYQAFWTGLSRETQSVLAQTTEHVEYKKQAATVKVSK